MVGQWTTVAPAASSRPVMSSDGERGLVTRTVLPRSGVVLEPDLLRWYGRFLSILFACKGARSRVSS